MPPKKVHKKCNVCQKQHCTARLHSGTVSTRRRRRCRCRRTCHLSVSKNSVRIADIRPATGGGEGLRVEQDFMSYAGRDLPEICDVEPAEVRRVATWLLAPAYGLCYTLVHVKLNTHKAQRIRFHTRTHRYTLADMHTPSPIPHKRNQSKSSSVPATNVP